MAALEEDLRYKEALGIWVLPAFLVECGGRSCLIWGIADSETLLRAVALVANCQ